MTTECDQYEQAKMMLVLRYGTMYKAYKAWCQMSLKEQRAIDQLEYELLMEYEYNMEYSVP